MKKSLAAAVCLALGAALAFGLSSWRSHRNHYVVVVFQPTIQRIGPGVLSCSKMDGTPCRVALKLREGKQYWLSDDGEAVDIANQHSSVGPFSYVRKRKV